MLINPDTPRNPRTISGLALFVAAPYAAGHVVTEGEAAILNQTIAENVSNNLREKLKQGFELTPASGETPATYRPYTEAEAQSLVDTYLSEYEPGVRRGGSGEARVVDPVEREARKIAKAKALEIIKSRGLKAADIDIAPIVNQIFEKNKDVLMAAGKKVVKELEAAKAKGDSLDFGDLDFGAPQTEAA